MESIFHSLDNILPADRKPCPVCGHPSGDCSSDDLEEPRHVLGPDAFPSMGIEERVVVKEDVWQERWISPFTQPRIRVAVAGTAIPLSLAKEFGIVTND